MEIQEGVPQGMRADLLDQEITLTDALTHEQKRTALSVLIQEWIRHGGTGMRFGRRIRMGHGTRFHLIGLSQEEDDDTLVAKRAKTWKATIIEISERNERKEGGK